MKKHGRQPIDLVLVLDTSGSMSDCFDNDEEGGSGSWHWGGLDNPSPNSKLSVSQQSANGKTGQISKYSMIFSPIVVVAYIATQKISKKLHDFPL